MTLKKYGLLVIFSLFLIPNSVFGIAELENRNIIAEDNDREIILSLEFGKNMLSKFGKIIPTLQSGLLVVGDSILEIEKAKAKVMGDSFVVHSENMLIYAKGLGDGNYLINTYLIGANQLEPIKLKTVTLQDSTSGVKNNFLSIDLIVLVRQDIRTFWSDTYDIEIKVFDKAKNPRPQFHQSLGAINQAEVDVTLKKINGDILTKLTGKTNAKGFWSGNYFVKQNIVSGGTYIVEVEVNHFDSNNSQKFETFVIADSKSSKSSD